MSWTLSQGRSKLAACAVLLASAVLRPSDAPAAPTVREADRGSRAVLATAALAPGGRPAELRLSAKKLSYRPAGGAPCAQSACASVLELAGSVQLSVGELRLTAQHAELLLDAGGRLRRASARGGVIVDAGRGRGRAERAELALSPALAIELVGSAELDWTALGLQLRGARIAIDLASGTAVVHEAQAALRPGNRNPRQDTPPAAGAAEGQR